MEKPITLVKLKKYSQAVKELDAFLTQEPGNARAYALKAVAHDAMKETRRALENAHKAVSLAPEDAYAHYVLGIVHFNRTKDYKKAEVSIREALRLNPNDADHYESLARIKMARREFAEALKLCDKGLQIDAENANCRSTRAQVLTKLGKRKAATLDMKEALKVGPEDPSTLARAGWVRLENDDYNGALEMFAQALRVQPDHESAREGLIQALKAKNFVYRQYLRYAFWINRLEPRTRWFLILGAFFIVRLMRLSPIFMPIAVVYGLFVISTWIINPFSNLFLRFNKYGKYALTKSDVIASNIMAICIFLTIILGITTVLVNQYVILGALAVFLMMIPVSGTASFHSTNPAKFKKAIVFTIVLCSTLVLGLGLLFVVEEAGIALLAITLLGEVAFTWIFGALTG